MDKCQYGSVQQGEHCLGGKSARLAVLRILLATSLLLVLTLLFAPPFLFAQTAPRLLAPSTAETGETFEVRVEDAPEGASVKWSWETGKLNRAEFTATVVRFKAVLDGNAWVEAAIDNAWQQRIQVRITLKHVTKLPKRPPGQADDPKVRQASDIFERFRSDQIKGGMEFFRAMGDEGLAVKDMVAFKDYAIEYERARLIAEENKPAREAFDLSLKFWDRQYGGLERNLLSARQPGVERAWKAAVAAYKARYPDRAFGVVRMDVGGWATELKPEMRLEGDIDFSILILREGGGIDVEDAKLLRGLFAAEVHREFGLSMKELDALGTAHRAATEDVFIGDYGAKWAERDAVKRGKWKAMENDGTLRNMEMSERAEIVAVLQCIDYGNKTGQDLVDTVMAEVQKPQADLEPGISLEFLRHLQADAMDARITYFEKILRIAKYAARSVSDSSSPSRDAAFADIVLAIYGFKSEKGTGKIAKILQAFEAAVGKNWADDPSAAVERFGEHAAAMIRNNIEAGINHRLKLIDGQSNANERQAERKKLLDDLVREHEAFKNAGIEYPKAAYDTMVELAKAVKRTSFLKPEEMKKLKEITEKAAENDNSLKIMVATVWEKVSSTTAIASEKIDRFNEWVDVLDNKTVAKLRTMGDEFSFMDGKVTLTLPLNIGRINAELNQGVLGKIGQNIAFKSFNLAQEGLAYYDAVMGAADWNESFTNLATEIFRRRVPAGGAVEAGMQGNYLYAGVQVVYMIFPPLAIPEGLYGMAASMADWGVGAMNQWRYDAMVETLYSGATFQKDGAAWKMTGLAYDCPPLIELSIGKDAKSKEGLYKLLDSCAKISSILYPQVKQHPALLQYEEMLGNSAVSSGRTSILGMNSGWPYQYSGLSLYGEALYKIYLKKVDAVTLEYYKGVIDGLEKRKAWDSGTGYSQIVAIEKELGCTAPLVQYTVGYLGGDAIKRDAERFQAIVDSYKRLKAANKEITDIGEKWQVSFLKGPTPQCTPESIDKTEKEAKGLLGRLQQAVEAARKEVVAFVGNNPTDEDLARPTRARLCMTVNDRASEPYRRCYEDHKAALDKLAGKAVDLTVAVVSADEVCVAQKVSLAVSYNKPCPECALINYEILDESGRIEEQLNPTGAKTPWTPGTTGRKTIRANVDLTVIKDVLKVQRKGEKPVTVKTETDCPRLKVSLDAGGVTEIGKDGQLTLTVRPVSLAPGNPPISRYFWKEDGVDKLASAEPTYLLSGKGKGDRTVNVTVVARDAEQNLSEPAGIDIRVTDTATAAIPVTLRPVDLPPGPDGTFSIKEDAIVTLKATSTPKTDSGRLRFQWSADGKLIDPDKTHTDSTVFKGEGWSGKTVTIALVVMDEKNREGKGSISINVLPSKGLGVSFEDHPKIVTERDVVKIRVKEPPRANYRYTWTRQGIKGLEKTTFDFLDAEFQGLAGKTLTIRVDVYDDAGRTGFAETSIAVTEPKPEEEKIPVEIRSDRETIGEDGATDLTAFASAFADSGKLTYFWAESPQGAPGNVFRLEGKGHQDVWVVVSVVVKDQKGRRGEGTKSVYVERKGSVAAPVIPPVTPEDKKEAAPGDPKQQAEAKYRWLKESVAYLEALKEYDRKSYDSFEKSVTSSIVREFVSKTPPRYDKEFKLPDGNDKELCGETFGDIRDRLTGYESECWSTLNAGCKTVGTREFTRTVDGKEMKFAESISSCDAPCGKAQSCSNVLKTYTGQLGYANSLQDYINEKQLGCLGEAGAANGKHQRELDKKIKDLPESLPYKRYQEYAGLNDWKGYLAAVEKVKQEFDLSDPIPSPIVLPWSYSSPCGGKGAAVETAKLAVTLAAKPEKTAYKPGEIVNVTANVTGGKPPYTYTWTGDHAGDGQTVTRAATKPGSYALSVEVKDGTGARGVTSITLKYEGVTAGIEGLTNQIIYGTSLKLRAKASVVFGEAPAPAALPKDKVDPEEEKACRAWNACRARARTDPKIRCMPPPNYECWDETPAKPLETSAYRVIWQSDKTLDFKPGTSYDGTTEVLFDRMGPVKISAEIQKKTGDNVYEQVGAAEQREVTVVAPKFKMIFNPEKGKGKVGQEVRVTIDSDPPGIKPEIVNYEWSWPESSGRMEYAKNAGVIGFIPKDPKPVKLLVGPKTVYDRVPIGGAILDEYTAGAFNVTVTGPRVSGPAPQVWKEGVGLVDVQREIAVFQNVFMKVEVAPDPEKKPLRYQWTVTPGGCTVGSDVSQEITVNCSQTGSYQAKVSVKDRDGADLGSGAGTISVTISQNEITKAKDKKKEVEEKLAKARALRQEGKFDESIALVDEVLKIDPKHEEAKQFLVQLKKEKGDADKKIAGVNADIDNAKFDEAERELKPLKGSYPQYPPVQAAEKKLAAEREKTQGKAGAELAKVSEAVKARDFKQALVLAGEVRKTTKLNPKQDSELAGLERTARDQEAKKERARTLLQSGEAKLGKYDYDGALADLAGGLSASQDLWSTKDTEPARFVTLKTQAETKAKRLKELLPAIRQAAEGKPVPPADELKKALASADEAKALQPTNGQIANYRKLIEQRLAAGEKENEKIKTSKELRERGEAAQKQGKIPEAVSSFRESLKLVPDPALEAHVKILETRLEQDKAKVETAKKLRAEGEALQGQGKTAEAVAKYRESLKYVPDAKLEEHIKALDAKLAGETAKIETAKKLRAEGEALQSQGKTAEAVAKYRESLKYVPDAKLDEHIRVLEAQDARQAGQRKTADQLWQDGTALFNQGRPGEALAKFKESLKYSASPERVKYVQDLEGRKAQAEKLRSEGASFQNQGKLREAAGKYRESLGYWPDPGLKDHIAKIEAEIKKQETQVVTQPPTSESGGADGTWEVSFNNYRGKMELQRSGSSWSGRLWLDAHQRWEQLTNISYSSTGRLEFTRPISGATQRYSGALSGERLEGTFTQENGSTKYAWWANRTQAGTDKPTGSDASNASFPLQISRNVPNQNSSAFKQNVRKDLSMDTTAYDKIPYSMHVSSHDLMIAAPAKFCLAGDAGGTKGWSVDNFLLIEILDQSGNLISSALAGNTETVRRNGNPIEMIGRSSYSFNACEIDITKLLPVGKPFRLRASAMDYGGVGYVSDVFIVSSKGTSGVVSQSPSSSPSAKGKVIFTNGNTGGIYNNPSRATTFTLREPHVITLVTNYHWNNGRGATPGTIALRGSDGRTYGSWRTSGSPGQGGVPNANWNAAPNVTLPAGTYTVVDSDPATWAQNSESGGAGHTRIEGNPAGGVR